MPYLKMALSSKRRELEPFYAIFELLHVNWFVIALIYVEFDLL
jgi:hypothetical protein